MSDSKEGWLKIKLENQSKWHRRYCIIDWHKAVLFIASKSDTRYKNWIKLLPDIIINDHDYSFNNETNNNLLVNIIEIKADHGTATHLLQTETRKDFESWLIALKRTAYSRVGGGIFGQSLDDTYKYARDKSSLVPLIVRQCCEYLLEHGLTFVGLFRVPGKQSLIKELRDMYDRGLIFELKDCYSPATISSLLKSYLQSLPEPIIPKKCFDHFFEIGSRFKYNQTNDLNHLKQLIEIKLPNINYAILAYLCLFLKKLTDHVQITKMDTDNLAVVFGNNLIRPVEELDLNMVKGHNYNLLPLIKVLIDHSEYLFSNSSTNHLQDSYEHTNESITKSSGFSSFSSLLSTNDHLIIKHSRSLSMPSICLATYSSIDSANLSLESQSEIKDIRRQKSFIEKEISFTTNQLSFETKQIENNIHLENKSNIQHKRFGSTDLLDDNKVQQRNKHNPKTVDDIFIEKNQKQKQKSDNPIRPVSTIGVPIGNRKIEKNPSKKSFAIKFTKSFSSLKSSMTKALQSHTSQNDNESPIIDSSTNQQFEIKSLDSQLTNNSYKNLQNDIDLLKESLDKKELIIIELTKNFYEERLKFENEIFQLHQNIEQLQNENIQLKKQLNMQ